jgi:RNA polymerase sigma-70 factor (ECF subfamily)
VARTIAATPVPRSQPDAVAQLDEATFSELYRQTSRPLWAYVYRVTGHAADADDIVQEAYLRLLRAGPAAADDEQRRRFLYRVASNLVVDRWRKESRTAQIEARTVKLRATGAMLPPADEGRADLHGPRQESGSRDLDVANTFGELSPRDRALLWLAYVEEQSHTEIAASLRVGARSVKVLVFRAKRRLRELLRLKGLASTP